MSTCLARLGSRYSLLLDPIRRRVHYGSLGLLCQREAELQIGLQTLSGRLFTLPLTRRGEDFYCVDQHLTMTSVRYEARCLEAAVAVEVTLTAPFWPQDIRTSVVPAYIVDVRVRRVGMTRWQIPPADVRREGLLRVALHLPGVEPTAESTALRYRYPVRAVDVFVTGEGGGAQRYRDDRRQSPQEGTAEDLLFAVAGGWRVEGGELRADFRLDDRKTEQDFRFGLASWCGDALFERFGVALPLKYTAYWKSVDAVAAHVRRRAGALVRASRAFDSLVTLSSLPTPAQDLTALSFQSYLMCSLWATGPVPRRDGRPSGRRDWFSVWEGSCWFNSTVDVTYNEAPFYFSCWPQLLELLFDEWAEHANDFDAETVRRARVSDDDKHGNPLVPFPGAILEHDLGAGWSANGQSYHHAMPVEENANFLLLLYAHARWWDRMDLLDRHGDVCAALADYLLWADSTGNGFPDRGTANTIDDANPAVQYGRDNVYLGVKRLAALHAAGRIFTHTGDTARAARCRRAVRAALGTLRAGWLGDHYPVVLDRSARGLVDAWTKKPLTLRTLPGWDAYSLYTSNGLLYLLMADDLPPGLSLARIRADLRAAVEESLTPYGCSHSSFDPERIWISMNLWRDCVAAYLGDDLLDLGSRYWAQQLFANGPGGEKPNAFTETSLANNLVWYPRGAASFGLLFSAAGLVRRNLQGKSRIRPVRAGDWPLLPLADWKTGRVPVLRATRGPNGRWQSELGAVEP